LQVQQFFMGSWKIHLLKVITILKRTASLFSGRSLLPNRLQLASIAMGSERRLEEKKGLVDDAEASSKVDVAPGEQDDPPVPGDAAVPASPSEPVDQGKAQRVMPIGELPSRQKPKTGISPRKKKKRPEDEQEAEPVEFRVNGILVDKDVKGGAKKNWMGVYMVLFRTSTPLGQRVAFILIGLVTISVSVGKFRQSLCSIQF